MKRLSISWLCLLAVAGALFAVPAAAKAAFSPVPLAAEDLPEHVFVLDLGKSRGYRIGIGAISEGYGRRAGLSVSVAGENGFAAYFFPATVTATAIQADLGPFGKVDLALNASGRERTIHVKCSKGQKYPFEPATFEGLVEFRGEGGFVRARATRLPLRPLVTSFCGSGSGKGESSGVGSRGARLRVVSFAHGRALSLQVNKNHARGRAPYTAEIRERRDGVSIYRAVEGWLPAASFRYDPQLQTARLDPPAPFSGAADLSRNPNSVSPKWRGDLVVDFPGRRARLTGPGTRVSLVPACFTLSDEPMATSC